MKPHEKTRYAGIAAVIGVIFMVGHIDFSSWSTWAGIIILTASTTWFVRTVMELKFARDGAYWQNVFGNPHPSEPEMQAHEQYLRKKYHDLKELRRRHDAEVRASRVDAVYRTRMGFHSDRHAPPQDGDFYVDETQQW